VPERVEAPRERERQVPEQVLVRVLERRLLEREPRLLPLHRRILQLLGL
jgi:hypothetical protein